MNCKSYVFLKIKIVIYKFDIEFQIKFMFFFKFHKNILLSENIPVVLEALQPREDLHHLGHLQHLVPLQVRPDQVGLVHLQCQAILVSQKDLQAPERNTLLILHYKTKGALIIYRQNKHLSIYLLEDRVDLAVRVIH